MQRNSVNNKHYSEKQPCSSTRNNELMTATISSAEFLKEVEQSITDYDKLNQLLDLGTDINYRNEADGNTALAIATHKNDIELVDFILWSGADPLLTNDKGLTPRDQCEIGSAIFYSLLDFELHFSAMYGDLPLVKKICQENALVNFQGPMGYNALLLAIESDQTEVVEFLLSMGADLEVRTLDGKSPHNLAQSEKIKSMLVEAKIIPKNSPRFFDS